VLNLLEGLFGQTRAAKIAAMKAMTEPYSIIEEAYLALMAERPMLRLD